MKDDDKDKEGPLTLLAVAGTIVVVFGFLIWMVASHRIVFSSLKPGLFFGAMWKWLPSDYAVGQWNFLVRRASGFYQGLNQVTVTQWGEFISVALQPLMAVMTLGYAGLLALIFRRKADVTRKFSVDALMEHAAHKFTGNLPIVTLRKVIAANKHSLWRLQVTPEEIFRDYKAERTDGSVAAGTPMVHQGKFNRDVARIYFMGLSAKRMGGRLVSAMLGRQIVDLMSDAPKAKSIVFADRMSPLGKALLALWTPVAFGGDAGRKEHAQYRDALNRSAFGTRDGMANLTLIQPLYDKYRNHPELRRIFAVHHWEYTVLFALLARAQRFGRFTTAEVLWVRPMNRVLFFALNSRGRFTPHTEGAACYAMHQFETECAKAGRLPLWKKDNVIAPMIYVNNAIDGLEEAYKRYAEGQADEDDIWMNKDIWKKANAAVVDWSRQSEAAVPNAPMPHTAGEQATNAFDEQQQELASRSNQARTMHGNQELADLFTGSAADGD